MGLPRGVGTLGDRDWVVPYRPHQRLDIPGVRLPQYDLPEPDRVIAVFRVLLVLIALELIK